MESCDGVTGSQMSGGATAREREQLWRKKNKTNTSVQQDEDLLVRSRPDPADPPSVPPLPPSTNIWIASHPYGKEDEGGHNTHISSSSSPHPFGSHRTRGATSSPGGSLAAEYRRLSG
ncbi:hypothetical protein EYF80_037100 [Liparis tanakae]|uniref:Uncharacterized protein n=1 Tax=Liparis tanakae TaxID=230148 RepID=A0A4Z2GHC6_9TELE|nr:hypothetical protein EYF80_037100 [Liparis tanakae]